MPCVQICRAHLMATWYMLKASFSSFKFYADGFVELGGSKALFSSFEFHAWVGRPLAMVHLWVC